MIIFIIILILLVLCAVITYCITTYVKEGNISTNQLIIPMGDTEIMHAVSTKEAKQNYGHGGWYLIFKNKKGQEKCVRLYISDFEDSADDDKIILKTMKLDLTHNMFMLLAAKSRFF